MRFPAGPLCFILLLFAGSSGAQQYDLRVFSLEEGLPSASVNALCEDHDGFLWIGTVGGASRSEGSRFQNYGRAEGLPTDEVTALCASPSGPVYIGCSDGSVVLWNEGSLVVLPQEPRQEGHPVSALALDGEEGLWAAIPGLGMLQFANSRNRIWGLAEGLPSLEITAMVIDTKNRLIVGTVNGLAVFDGAGFRALNVNEDLPSTHVLSVFSDSLGILVGTTNGYAELSTELEQLPIGDRFMGFFPVALPDARILGLLRARNGDLWFGTPSGLMHLRKRHDQPTVQLIGESNGLGHNQVGQVMQDRSGAIWAGTGYGGITKFTSNAFMHFTKRDGLRSRIVSDIHRTPDGLLWLATAGGGISCWNGKELRNFGSEEGLLDQHVVCLAEDKRGYLLIGTETKGMFRVIGNKVVPFPEDGVLRERRIARIRRDDRARLWIATDNGLYCDRGGEEFMKVLGGDMAVSDVEVNSDTVWVTSASGLYRVDATAKLLRLKQVPGIPKEPLNTIASDSQGNLWIGSKDQGVYRLHGNKIDSISVRNGLCSPVVEQILLDAYENVWVGTRRGIDLLELDVLQERVLSVKHYGTDEGFIGIEAFRNASMLDVDSTLWFGTLNGATRYDPREELEDPREPMVHFTDLRLFHEHPDWTTWSDSLGSGGMPMNLSLPYNKNHLTFSFTGISLAYPERVRYRYVLEGYDPDWSPITSTDRVIYSNIPPGEYTFRVHARNASGIWTEAPLSFPFTVRPPFWATAPFRFGGGAVVLLGLFGFIRLRERNLRKDRERLEGMVKKRTVELNDEKDRSDALLRNILPASTAEELKQHGAAEAKRYDNCTVLFSDFKGFTGFSSLMDSDTLVSELDHFFRQFDKLTDTYGTEKIKTIGDAYMCASGIPEPKPTHALDAVLMGLGMIAAVDKSNAERKSTGKTEWPIRIGIHSGPVVAGVVGEKKFAYDIWGDTVNLASRMESMGEPGKLNISGATYAQVMDFVDVIPRGPIKVKGKGELHMYFVTGLKAEIGAKLSSTH